MKTHYIRNLNLIIIMISFHWQLPHMKSSSVGKLYTDTYIYVPSIKNQYKRGVIEYMVIYVMVIEIFQKIINWHIKYVK